MNKYAEQYCIASTIVTLCILLICCVCHGAEIPKERVINAIIGEAEGGGLEGMRCVASGINNRGTLKGVYGEKARRVTEHKYSPRTFVLAVQAYEDAKKHDFVYGATHWEGVSFKIPKWSKGMNVTTVCGGNRFYK